MDSCEYTTVWVVPIAFPPTWISSNDPEASMWLSKPRVILGPVGLLEEES
jgi:hypothetical protein